MRNLEWSKVYNTLLGLWDDSDLNNWIGEMDCVAYTCFLGTISSLGRVPKIKYWCEFYRWGDFLSFVLLI